MRYVPCAEIHYFFATEATEHTEVVSFQSHRLL